MLSSLTFIHFHEDFEIYYSLYLLMILLICDLISILYLKLIYLMKIDVVLYMLIMDGDVRMYYVKEIRLMTLFWGSRDGFGKLVVLCLIMRLSSCSLRILYSFKMLFCHKLDQPPVLIKNLWHF